MTVPQTTSRVTPAAVAGAEEASCIIVLDDEQAIQRLLKLVLESEGYEVMTTDDGRQALDVVRHQPVDLIIQDLRMPKMDGLAFLRQLKEVNAELPSIVLTAYGTLETAVEAMRLGAYTHINKPFDTDEIRLTVSRALERLELRKKNLPRSHVPFLDIIGNSTTPMSNVSRLIEMAAPTDSTILISGESGTGKELVARAIHYNSLRADQAFIPVNCGAFTETLLESELFGHVRGAFTNAINNHEGVFERADRGTLFLDEVGEMSLTTQVKLLRVLETRTFKPVGGSKDLKVDVRFITATNRNLSSMVAEGQFREDLFYRLNVIPIQLPPLRERREDIPLLAGHFLARNAKRANKNIKSMEDAAVEKLLSYPWPGNVRELENTLERAVALARGDRLTALDITLPQQQIYSSGQYRTLQSNAGPRQPQQPQRPQQPVLQESFARSYNAGLSTPREYETPGVPFDAFTTPIAPIGRPHFDNPQPAPQNYAPYQAQPQQGAPALHFFHAACTWPGSPRPYAPSGLGSPPTARVPAGNAVQLSERLLRAAGDGHAAGPSRHAHQRACAADATGHAAARRHGSSKSYLLEQERSLIIQALERCNWNLTEAARLLHMTFRSIRYRVAKLGIERPGKGGDFSGEEP